MSRGFGIFFPSWVRNQILHFQIPMGYKSPAHPVRVKKALFGKLFTNLHEHGIKKVPDNFGEPLMFLFVKFEKGNKFVVTS